MGCYQRGNKLKEKTLIIIGGGPAGLRAALEAQNLGIDHLILEKGEVAQAWKEIRPDMTMLSPCHPQRDWTSISSAFPIWKLPITRPFCTAQEFVHYLQEFSANFNLNLHTHVEVKKIQRSKNRFLLDTTKGQYIAQTIFVATGFLGNPYIPQIPGFFDNPIVIHSHHYKSPEALRNKRVVIIGAGNSAAETAIALAGYAQVYLITRSELKFFSKTKNLCHIRGISESMLLELIQMEMIRHIAGANIQKLENNILHLQDRSIEIQSIICATGYRPVLNILRKFNIAIDPDTKFPVIEPWGEAKGIKNLFFGGPLAYTGMGSLFIHGFIKTVPVIIQEIRNRIQKKEALNVQ
jgi:thioredoxin reductase (NADPH)